MVVKEETSESHAGLARPSPLWWPPRFPFPATDAYGHALCHAFGCFSHAQLPLAAFNKNFGADRGPSPLSFSAQAAFQQLSLLQGENVT